jgi:bifunctional DNA-binding transcriptional regulator/antitoxin component of YhaV-PrlF toxin-antitoxin module
MTAEYKVEDLFKPIPGDSDNVNLVIPPEIYEAQGWKEGDQLKVEVGDMGTVIITKVDDTK